MKKTIVFVHGMFQNPKSWEKWINYFTARGYNCIAPAWPEHEGEPAELRRIMPADLGDLRLETVLKKIEDIISTLNEKPIVIGHSVGGLIVQLLSSNDMISLGVPINSVAPNAMLAFDWSFFKNSMSIANPFKGDEPFIMTNEGFYASFCNSLSEAEAKVAYEETATHDSRNVLRDCMMQPGHINLDLPHVPLLFIAGEEDKIIPAELVEKNSKAYNDKSTVVDYKKFANRSHYICNEPGWEEVAAYVYQWIDKNGQGIIK